LERYRGPFGGLQTIAAMKSTKIHAATRTKFPIELFPPSEIEHARVSWFAFAQEVSRETLIFFSA